MNQMMQDPMVIYGISFTLFIVLAFIFGRKPVLAWIDGEITKIRVELDTARQLRAEAEATLADCKEKQARAEIEARMIIDMAKREAQDLRKQAEADLVASMARHGQLAAERIRMFKEEALAEVRNAGINAAMKMARTALVDNMSDVDAAKLIDRAIGDIPTLKSEKPKAA